MSALYILMMVFFSTLVASNMSPEDDNAELSPAERRVQLFQQIRGELDAVYELVNRAVNEDGLSDEDRSMLNQNAINY